MSLLSFRLYLTASEKKLTWLKGEQEEEHNFASGMNFDFGVRNSTKTGLVAKNA